MHKFFLQAAALLGALSVALGAFGAHALKKWASEAALAIFETGVRYQFYHVFALVVVGFIYRDSQNKWIEWAGNLFLTGIVLFSGSLYVLTYIKATAKTDFYWVGAITPLGGLAFIAGWISLFLGIMKSSVP